MAGVYKIEISESEAELKELLRQEKTGSGIFEWNLPSQLLGKNRPNGSVS